MIRPKDPERAARLGREWRARSAMKYAERKTERFRATKQLAGEKGLERRTKLKPVNRERRKKLSEKQFGDKAVWHRERTGVCDLTGLPPSDQWPLEVAHVGHPDREVRRAGHGTRGNGADATYTLLLRKDVHFRFDNLDEAKWEEFSGWSKTAVRELSAEIHEAYLSQSAEMVTP